MLSGVKFIPRDQVQDNEMDSSSKEKKKSDNMKRKNKRKGKSCRNSSSDEDFEKIKSSRKKWYSSEEENSSAYNSESESEPDEKKHRRLSQKKRRSRRGKKEYTSEDYSFSSSGGSDTYSDRKLKSKRVDTKDERKTKRMKRGSSNIVLDSESEKEIARKEMGLEWMLRSESRRPVEIVEKLPEDAPVEVTQKVNPKELNPYLMDNGSGYPEVNDEGKIGADQLLSSSLVGDGGASWRLKALKRAQEQAAREGRRLDEVVQERWGSLGELTASVASHAAASSRAHLHAIKSRKSGLTEEQLPDLDNWSGSNSRRDYLKGATGRHREMRTPKIKDSLSWGKQKSQSVAAEGAGIISSAASSLNKFANDGSFLHEFLHMPSNDSDCSVQDVESEKTSLEAKKPAESGAVVKDVMSANQMAAKALQLRLKGKHEEADKLSQEAKNMNTKQDIQGHKIRSRAEASSSRYAMQNKPVEKKKEEEDADMHLARKIMQNKQYNISTQADDEYDFEDGQSDRKGQKKRGRDDHKFTQKNPQVKKFLTQQERCLFCLENPNRPMHLVISIANYTYLMLPQLQPVVPGHCCILPIQHESATRMVDDDVWTEIRNFKKCLIMMFAKQEKEVVFLETVMGLAQQRRHCMIDCIPLPQNIAKEAPLYFKKAIDEAEDEWSQHNAKKLIDTSQKGLRNSIPKHFPYFHVEFGLSKGFVHVIDDEKLFKSSLGLNVIRGMLQLPEEEMYRRRRYDSMDGQKQAVASFCKEWDPFDWTKQLHQ